MPRRKVIVGEELPKMPPAKDPEAREAQLIALAEWQAEQMMRKGNAPAPIVVHYLRRATEKDKLEQEKLRLELELTKAKTEALKATQASNELMEAAIAAMKSYKGGDENG